jgi:cell division protein FtsB
MKSRSSSRVFNRHRVTQAGALLLLLVLGGLAVAGPYGLLTWSENRAKLEQREQRIAELEARHAEYENLVERLDPENVDPDLASELVRRNLNVAHPDEYIIELDAH